MGIGSIDIARWGRRAASIVGGTVILLVLMAITDMAPNPLLVVVAGLGGGVAASVVFDLVTSSSIVAAGPFPSRAGTAPRVDARIRSLRFNLRSMRDERADRLYRLLVELIDDQLIAAHGIDRASQPDRAAAIIGPDLQRFVDDPGAARSLKRLPRLERIVTEIERI